MISRLAFCIALICSLPLALHAQSTEEAIKARLKNKPLYLRGFWGDDRLSFDSAGRLRSKSYPVSFTLAGFNLQRIRLQKGQLILDGARMGLELSGTKPQRVPLQRTDTPPPPITMDQLTPQSFDEFIHIEIAARPDGDYGTALDQIFVDGFENLAPLVPFYWSKFASEHFSASKKPAAAPLPASNSSGETKKQPPTMAPILLTSAEPQFTDSARVLRYGGISIIQISVRPDGTVNNPIIVAPIGIGLDENAIIALLHYTFKPATQNGQPITSEITIAVNFETERSKITKPANP